MSGRRIIALVGLTIALVFALAAGAPNFDGEREADAGALTPADVCADPDDCRLWEAGQIAGVRVGFAVGSVNQAQGRRGELLLAETNIGFYNAINWQRIWPERDRWSFTQADNMAAYHRENGLPMTAQHFVFFIFRDVEDVFN